MRIIIKEGKAIDQAGNGYEITGVLIKKPNFEDKFYDKTTSFYKASCPDGTRHEAEILESGKVRLI